MEQSPNSPIWPPEAELVMNALRIITGPLDKAISENIITSDKPPALRLFVRPPRFDSKVNILEKIKKVDAKKFPPPITPQYN